MEEVRLIICPLFLLRFASLSSRFWPFRRSLFLSLSPFLYLSISLSLSFTNSWSLPSPMSYYLFLFLTPHIRLNPVYFSSALCDLLPPSFPFFSEMQTAESLSFIIGHFVSAISFFWNRARYESMICGDTYKIFFLPFHLQGTEGKGEKLSVPSQDGAHDLYVNEQSRPLLDWTIIHVNISLLKINRCNLTLSHVISADTLIHNRHPYETILLYSNSFVKELSSCLEVVKTLHYFKTGYSKSQQLYLTNFLELLSCPH